MDYQAEDPYQALYGTHHELLDGAIPFECGPGWFNLIRELCQALEAINQRRAESGKTRLKATQVKEKFGGLRFYLTLFDVNAAECIQEAEFRSFGICEDCGQAGRIGDAEGWLCVCRTRTGGFQGNSGMDGCPDHGSLRGKSMMDPGKQRKLRAAGWCIGTAGEFLAS